MANVSADLAVISVCGLVAYDGTDYSGFQVQANTRSIQGALEEALDRVARRVGRITGAGRTDSGVHAVGQVIAVQVQWRHPVAQLQNAWNAHLPDAIQLRDLCLAPPGFHPRYSAVARQYRYLVCASTRSGLPTIRRWPFAQRVAHFEPYVLDLAAMQQATQYLLGEHDFGTFGRPPKGNNSVRHVIEAEWRVVETDVTFGWPDAQGLLFTISANAFLTQMVRNIVGSLLSVGRGRWQPERIKEIRLAKDRGQCAPPASPAGLTLFRVAYPDELNPWPGC